MLDTKCEEIDQPMNSSERTPRLLQGAKCHQRRTTHFSVKQREQCYRALYHVRETH